MKFVMSYSGGKDSALALYRMIEGGHQPVALITTVNKKQNRSWFHGIPTDLLEETAASLGIPLFLSSSESDEYVESIESNLQKAKEMGADSAVFGDIDIAGHYQWNKERCDAVGLNCCLPLWNQDRELLTRESINSGFKSMIKIVQRSALDESFLGQTLSFPLIERIKAAGSDVCGENGEYHTFVYDGPVFKFPLKVESRGIVDLGTHQAIDIVLKHGNF